MINLLIIDILVNVTAYTLITDLGMTHDQISDKTLGPLLTRTQHAISVETQERLEPATGFLVRGEVGPSHPVVEPRVLQARLDLGLLPARQADRLADERARRGQAADRQLRLRLVELLEHLFQRQVALRGLQVQAQLVVELHHLPVVGRFD